MNRRMRLAARLYPAAWRARYGEEFAALLEDAGGGWREWLDVLWGAVKMQIRMGSFAKLAAGCTLAGVAVAGFIAFRIPDRYTSTAVLQVSGTTRRALRMTLYRAEVLVLSRSSLAEIVQTLDLYKSERKRIPMEDVLQQMRNRDIRVVPVSKPLAGGPVAVQVQFAYPDAAAAERVTALLSTRLAEARTGSAKVEVLDPASWPRRAAGPNRLAIVALGLLAGLALVSLIFGIRRWPKVAASGTVAALLAGGLSYLIPNRYISIAVVQVSSPDLADKAIRAALTNESLARIIQDPRLDLYHRQRQKMAIDQVATLMYDRDVSVRPVGPPDLVQGYVIQSAYPDRYKAQAVVRELIFRIVSASRNGPEFIPSPSHSPEEVLRPRPEPLFEIIDPATLPERPASPNREAIAAIGLAAGLALGVLAQAFRGLHRPPTPATA